MVNERSDQITFGIVELVLNIDMLFLRLVVGVLEPTVPHISIYTIQQDHLK